MGYFGTIQRNIEARIQAVQGTICGHSASRIGAHRAGAAYQEDSER